MVTDGRARSGPALPSLLATAGWPWRETVRPDAGSTTAAGDESGLSNTRLGGPRPSPWRCGRQPLLVFCRITRQHGPTSGGVPGPSQGGGRPYSARVIRLRPRRRLAEGSRAAAPVPAQASSGGRRPGPSRSARPGGSASAAPRSSMSWSMLRCTAASGGSSRDSGGACSGGDAGAASGGVGASSSGMTSG